MSRPNIPKAAREMVQERAAGKCENCGGARPRLILHHRISFRRSNDHSPDNLVLVCPNCHEDLDHENGSRGRPRNVSDATERAKRGPGRPATGNRYTHDVHVYLDAETERLYLALKSLWGEASTSGMFRRLIREAARRERVTGGSE